MCSVIDIEDAKPHVRINGLVNVNVVPLVLIEDISDILIST